MVIRYFKFFQGLTKIVVNHIMIVQLYSYITIYQELNLKKYSFSFNLGEFRNSISIFCFLEQKLLEFSDATKSFTSVLYNKILSTIVKCICAWNSMTVHSFFPHLSVSLNGREYVLKFMIRVVVVNSVYFFWAYHLYQHSNNTGEDFFWLNNSIWTQHGL